MLCFIMLRWRRRGFNGWIWHRDVNGARTETDTGKNRDGKHGGKNGGSLESEASVHWCRGAAL